MFDMIEIQIPNKRGDWETATRLSGEVAMEVLSYEVRRIAKKYEVPLYNVRTVLFFAGE